MATFPIKKCVVCGEEFELRPGKPGFANRCPDCTDADAEAEQKTSGSGAEHENKREANQARREAMRDLLYRKDS